MVNFYSCYVISDCDQRNATVMDVVRLLKSSPFTIIAVHNKSLRLFQVRHIEHIRSVAGVEHIGIGGDFNGVEEFPEGLQDVSQYPNVRSNLIVNCVDQYELAVV